MQNFQQNINLAQFTTFKIGGKARYFCEAENRDEIIGAIRAAQEMSLPFFILGGGSNILFSDGGYNGMVIKIKNQKLKIKNTYKKTKNPSRYPDSDFVEEGGSFAKTGLIVESGMILNNLVNYTVKNDLTGLEWAAGIPGTIGGAVRGNAGAYNREFADVVESVEILNVGEEKTIRYKDIKILRNLEIKEVSRKNCYFGYRNSIFKQCQNLIILSAGIKLERGDKNQIQKKIKEIIEKRNKSLGKCYPSAGCVFKNPQTDNSDLIKMFERERGIQIQGGRIPARYLIEKLGFKGARIGGAAVSKNNANIILNEDNASAQDVLELIDIIREKIKREFGLKMELEIQIVSGYKDIKI